MFIKSKKRELAILPLQDTNIIQNYKKSIIAQLDLIKNNYSTFDYLCVPKATIDSNYRGGNIHCMTRQEYSLPKARLLDTMSCRHIVNSHDINTYIVNNLKTSWEN